MTELSFVSDLYRNVLFREPDAAGLNYWVNQLTLAGVSRDTVRANFINSAEVDAFVAPIIRLYENILGRAPDAAGLNAWSQALRTGTQTLDQITAGFLNSAEGQAAGWSGAGVTGQAFVTKIYTAMGRTAEQVAADPGAAAWAIALNQGRMSPASVAIAINESAENRAATAGFVTGYEALRSFGITQPSTAQAQAFSSSATTAQILSSAATVTGTSLPTGQGVTPQAGGTTGQAFTLTLSNVSGRSDNLTGTNGDDTFTGGAVGSLETGDVVDGGAGNDTLIANISAAVRPTLSSVETIQVTSSGAASVDLSASTGYTKLVDFASTNSGVAGVGGDLAFLNIDKASVVARVENVTRQNAAHDVAFTYTSSALSGSNDTITVQLANNGQSDVGGTVGANVVVSVSGGTNGAENLAVTTETNSRINSLASVDAAGTSVLKAVTFTGAGLSRVDTAIDFAGATGAGKIDATNAAGGINVVVNAADNVTVTGGAGNDRVDFGTFTNANDFFDGGAGTDTLALSSNGGALTAVPSNVKNVEVLELAAGAGNTITQDADFQPTGITSYVISGAGTNNFADLANDSTVTITSGTATAISVDLKANTADDILTLKLDSKTGGTITTLTAFADVANTAIETLNLVSGGGGANIITTNALDAAKIVVTGAQDLTLGTLDTLTTSVDARTFTGGLTVTASVTGTTIRTGSGADTITTGGTAADTVIAGDGNDRIVVGAADAIADDLTGGAGIDTFVLANATAITTGAAISTVTAASDIIRDFVSGTDKIELSAAGAPSAFNLGTSGTLTAGTNYFETSALGVGSTDAAIEAAATAAGIAAATPYVAAIQLGDHVYLAWDANAAVAGGVQIIGILRDVSLAGIAATDFNLVA